MGHFFPFMVNPHIPSIESIISGPTESKVDKVGNIALTLDLMDQKEEN